MWILVSAGLMTGYLYGQDQSIPFDQQTLISVTRSLLANIQSGDIEAAQLDAIRLDLASSGRMWLTTGTQPIQASMLSYVPVAEQLVRSAKADQVALLRTSLAPLTRDMAQQYAAEIHTIANRDNGGQQPADIAIRQLKVLLDEIRSGEIPEAAATAAQLLNNMDVFRDHLQDLHGIAFYKANDALGRAALNRGDVKAAEQYLMTASNAPSNLHLRISGPNLCLAHKLLELGYKDEVLTFLRSCQRFWDKPQLERWISDISSGRIPDMLPNSLPRY